MKMKIYYTSLILILSFCGPLLPVLAQQEAKAPKDNEKLVYPNPDKRIHLTPGDNHPQLMGWQFYTAHEFLNEHTQHGQPLGFIEHNTTFMSRMAKVDNKECAKVQDGILKINSRHYPDSIDNGYGAQVNLKTGAFRTPFVGDSAFWCRFTENMRIEVRLRRSDSQGLNDALWFMGKNGKNWPANGEIDLLENPKKKINQKAHFTLHSENHYAGVIGGKGSVTANIELNDMKDWNIYWFEWYPNRIEAGVNGQKFFEHHKGTDGNKDWPWSDPSGFFMLITTGVSTNPKAWPGEVNPSAWATEGLPTMEVDWVRVYVNKQYKGEPAPQAKFY